MERGSHSELMKLNGVYATLAKAQNLGENMKQVANVPIGMETALSFAPEEEEQGEFDKVRQDISGCWYCVDFVSGCFLRFLTQYDR